MAPKPASSQARPRRSHPRARQHPQRRRAPRTAATNPDRDSPTTSAAAMRPMAVVSHIARVVERVGDAAPAGRRAFAASADGRSGSRPSAAAPSRATSRNRCGSCTARTASPIASETSSRAVAAPSRAGPCRWRPARGPARRCARAHSRTPPRANTVARAPERAGTHRDGQRERHPGGRRVDRERTRVPGRSRRVAEPKRQIDDARRRGKREPNGRAAAGTSDAATTTT